MDVLELGAGELESRWQVEYRRAMSGWLLGQRSEHTRRAYGQAWRAWCSWCGDANLNPVEPGPGAGGAWLGSMRAAGLAEQTIRLRAIAVRGALVMLTMEGVRAGGDPFYAQNLAQSRAPSDRVGLSTVQVRRLVDTCRGLSGRYEAAVLLCAAVGMRAVEAGQVCDGVLSEYQGQTVATFIRKGGTQAVVPIPPVVLAAAGRDRWPHRVEKGMAANADRISNMVLYAWIKSGQPGRVRSHELRAWHVSAGLDAGVPLHQMQTSVGHRDPKTTMGYEHWGLRLHEHSTHTVAGLLGGTDD